MEIGLEKNIAEDSGKGLSVKITKTLEKATNRHREMKKEAYVKATFYKAELTKNIDYSWGKLHSATVKLDYSTKIEGGIKKSKDYDVGKVWTEGQNVTNSLSSVISGYQEALAAIKHDAYNTKFKNDEIYICRIAFLDIGVITGDFIIKGKVTGRRRASRLSLRLTVPTGSSITGKMSDTSKIKALYQFCSRRQAGGNDWTRRVAKTLKKRVPCRNNRGLRSRRLYLGHCAPGGCGVARAVF